MKKAALTKQAGMEGWSFASDRVEAFLTRTGGHLAPVTFKVGRRAVQPFAIAPWTDESLPGVPTMLKVLRGDFFCAPFGGNAAAFRGKRHPPHGETACRSWALREIAREDDAVTLHATMQTRTRPGRVDKRLTLRRGHTAVYCEHVLSGFRGPMPIGTHPMLKLPEREGAGRISASAFTQGHVVPEFERPAERGYSWLRYGATFTSLERVPAIDGTEVDLSAFPARRGFEELVLLVSEAAAPFAWTAVALPEEGYAFLSIKNPRVLRETVLWFSNGGRHYPPWNSRHVNVLGVEEVTAYFHLGLPASAQPNALNRAGVPTAVELDPAKPLRVAHILALAAIPRNFDRVERIEPESDGVTLVARSGARVTVPLDVAWVQR